MLPLQDVNPLYRRPYLTWALIGINVLVFLYQNTLPQRELASFILANGVIPFEVANSFSLDTALDIVRSMFIHGSWSHLFSNMLYLGIFGDNVEDRFGRLFFLLFYLLCGAAAAFTQVLVDPQSMTPMVGASGAIAGVLGAYVVLYPGVRVRGLIFFGFFARIAEVPALFVLGLWFVLQLFNGFLSLGVPFGIAFFAHVGGFVAGMALCVLFMMLFPQPPAGSRRQWVYDRHHYGDRWR